MRFYVDVADTDLSDSVLSETLSIEQDISDRISTASLTFKVEGGLSLARYDTALYDLSVYATDIRELYPIVIRDAGGKRYFGGTISRIEFDRQSNNLVLIHADCQDYTAILDRVIVPSHTFANLTDQAIIQTLISTYVPSLTATTANVVQLETLGVFEVKAETVREAIDRLCALTGAEWRVDYNANLLYFGQTYYPAPFGLSQVPNTAGATNPTMTWNQATQTWEQSASSWDADAAQLAGATITWDQANQTWVEAGSATWDDTSSLTFIPTYGLDSFTRYTRDFIRPVNSCKVLGGFLPGGTELTVTYEDPVSVLEYGRHAFTIVDRDISTGIDALLRAKALVDQHAYPEESFTLSTKHDGLEVGQSLPVYHADFQIAGTYVIRAMRITQLLPTLTNYEIDLGVRPPDTLRLLRQLEARSRRSTQVPTALAADGSVTTSSIGVGGINASVLIGTITGVNIDIDASNIFGTITGVNVEVDAAIIAGTIQGVNVTVDAGTIQGAITGGTIEAINVTTFQGAIISSQVADDLIDRLSLFATALRPIPALNSAPSVFDPAFPVGSYYYNKPGLQFYRNDAVMWSPVTEAETVSGKLEYFHVGTIKAANIVGAIIAAQIDSINAGSIIGTLTASDVGRIEVSALTGTLTVGNVAKIDIGSLQGTLTLGNVARIDFGAMVGQINVANQITNLTITGDKIGPLAITSDKIANLAITGAKIDNLAITSAHINTAAITGSHIGNLAITAANIANLTITDGKIASGINAGKITVGTLDANLVSVVNLTAASITTGTFAADRIGAGTIDASVTMTSPTLVITSGQIVTNIDASNAIKLTHSGTSIVLQMAPAGFSCATTSGFQSSIMNQNGVTVVSGGAFQASLGPTSLFLSGLQVVGPRQVSPVNPVGGSVIDVQARQSIQSIRSVLTAHGLTF